VLSRLWLLISLSWCGWLLYGFNSDGELKHLSGENLALLLTPWLIRLAVLFVVRGIPLGPRKTY
jgi:hypothetical protein